jgi:hypothetical protein
MAGLNARMAGVGQAGSTPCSGHVDSTVDDAKPRRTTGVVTVKCGLVHYGRIYINTQKEPS